MPNHYKSLKKEYPGLWYDNDEPKNVPEKKTGILDQIGDNKVVAMVREGIEIDENTKIKKASGIKRGFGVIFERKM